jgi:hypothetical protein
MEKVIINYHGQKVEADLDDRLWTYTDEGGTRTVLFLPGLDELIMIYARPTSAREPSWEFNNDKASPTLSPSILTTSHWGAERRELRNHVFVRNGMIEYLSDCTHDLAGKTIELPKLRDWPACWQFWR